MQPTLVINAMRASDWQQVCSIYLEGIATGNATFEQAAPTWEQWESSHPAAGCLVACSNAAVVGWSALSRVSDRCVYAGVAEVSTYVAQSSRGQGVGSALLAAIIQVSESQDFWTLQAGIFPENTASLSLHHRHGFREIGRRERIGRMQDRWRDVIFLERRSTVVGS